MTSAEATLALLLLLQQPGRSPYSEIVVRECDERCQREPVCLDEVLSCRPPRWSASRRKYTRLESWQEGVARYAVIGKAIANVASEMSCSGPSAAPDCTPQWPAGERSLRHLMVTVAFHESGFRRDVHDGSTLGDCDYQEIGGQLHAIPGTCRSHCLAQIFLAPGERTRRGYSAEQLVGIDGESTRRCVQTMADRLADANRSCGGGMSKGAHPACTMGMYGGVAGWQRDPRIAERRRTFERVHRSAPQLAPEVRAALAATTARQP